MNTATLKHDTIVSRRRLCYLLLLEQVICGRAHTYFLCVCLWCSGMYMMWHKLILNSLPEPFFAPAVYQLLCSLLFTFSTTGWLWTLYYQRIQRLHHPLLMFINPLMIGGLQICALLYFHAPLLLVNLIKWVLT